jgi:alkanesulfonate monooxygenase SsuD/methylene tetrahydromethanopterin reductase-like flavin-dependent oxidoreductase (luciferase family)
MQAVTMNRACGMTPLASSAARTVPAARQAPPTVAASHDEFSRSVQVWNSSYVVCRPTEKEAKDYLNYYVREKGDWQAVENLVRIFGMQSLALPSRVLEEFKFHFIAGWSGFPLVGTPEQIVDKLLMWGAARIIETPG